VAGKAHVPHLGVVFFLWVGIFNMMIVAQFWSFAADLYSQEQGKRLFAILGIGGTVGAVTGSGIARVLFKTLGEYGLMLAAAGILLAALAMTAVVDARDRRKGAEKATPVKEKPLEKGGGFAMLLRDRYLLMVAALSMVLNWVNTSGEYILDRALLEAAALRVPAGVDVAAWTDRFIGEYKADYFLWVNTASVLMQLFVVSRVIKYIGVSRALLIVPLVSLLGYSTLAFYPALAAILFVKITENTLDYSLQNTSRQALWLVTSRGAKYKAKSIIDTFVVRAGDLLSAAVTAIGAAVHLATVHFIMINAVLAACWVVVVVFLSRQYDKHREAEPSDRTAPVRLAAA
jgi:AAA family ATP:ADP antiporter